MEEVVVVVHEIETAREPAGVRLGEIELDVLKASEDACGYELRHAINRRMRAGSLGQGVGERLARCASARVDGGRADFAEAEVGREADAEVLRQLPEAVVLGGGVAGAVGELIERDASQPALGHEFKLFHSVVYAAHRHYGVADEPVGGDRAVVFGEEGVVGPDHGAVYLGVGYALQEASHEHRREEHFGVYAVQVLLSQTLIGRACAFGGAAVGVEVGAARELHLVAAGDVLPVAKHRLALYQPGFAAFRQVDQARRSVLPLLWHILDETFRRNLYVSVT